ncbi:hypothetical protein COBT_003975 [Conglomerata obtusa]
MRYCLLVSNAACDYPFYEKPNIKYIFEKPIFNEFNYNDILTLTAIKSKSKAHQRILTEEKNFIDHVKACLDSVRAEYLDNLQIFNECEKIYLKNHNYEIIEAEHIKKDFIKILNDKINKSKPN